MLNQEELQRLHTNQRLLVMELQRRNIAVQILDENIELLEASLGSHKEFFLDRDSSIMPYAASVICGNKFLAKRLLRDAGISVMEGQSFCADETNDALVYAQHIGFPLVVKPNFGSHGNGVHMDLENLCDVKEAIDELVKSNGGKPYLIEEQFEGKEYRVFVTKKRDYAILHRDPAYVIGDGKKSIEELAKAESAERTKETGDSLFPRENCLCPIMLDNESQRYLARSGKSFSYVPQEGEKVYLRHNSNVAMGATCEDFTDKAHPSVIEISRKALEVFHGLPYAGMDFLTKDVMVEQTPELYRLIEVNSVPGLHMHMRPGAGQSRDVASYMVDMIFSEANNGRE